VARRRPLEGLRGCCGRASRLDRGSVRDVTVEGFGEAGSVVRIDLGIVTTARDRHVGQAVLSETSRRESPLESSSVIRLLKESERERRLLPGEEDQLLAVANPQLRALITAALETGCRIGELLSLQWRQVRWDLNEIHLPAAKTKARRPRDLPMSQRLQALLDMRDSIKPVSTPAPRPQWPPSPHSLPDPEHSTASTSLRTGGCRIGTGSNPRSMVQRRRR
jgi:integrase